MSSSTAPVRLSRLSLSSIPAPWIFSSLITLILVVGQLLGDIIGGYDRLVVALGAAVLAEIVLSRFVRGVWPSLLSAYISGNSVAILTKSAGDTLWPYALGAVLAITSKYALTYKQRHLWNPTNFSITALLLLAPGSMSVLSHQWGEADRWAWFILLPVGVAVVWRAKLLHISLTYALCFTALAGLRTLINPAEWPFWGEVGPLTGVMYLLLLFFMLTDPRTTVSTRNGRILVVVLIALLECAIRLLPLTPWEAPLGVLLTAPPIFALAIIGPIAKWLDLRRLDARAAAASSAPLRAGARTPAAAAP
ncbi:MAG: hypothetical protein ACT4PU_09900 [Planctomycetota bacterium]